MGRRRNAALASVLIAVLLTAPASAAVPAEAISLQPESNATRGLSGIDFGRVRENSVSKAARGQLVAQAGPVSPAAPATPQAPVPAAEPPAPVGEPALTTTATPADTTETSQPEETGAAEARPRSALQEAEQEAAEAAAQPASAIESAVESAVINTPSEPTAPPAEAAPAASELLETVVNDGAPDTPDGANDARRDAAAALAGTEEEASAEDGSAAEASASEAATAANAAPPTLSPAETPVRSDQARLVAGSGVHDFTIEIADDPMERARGLMFRETMARDHGMLFDFGNEGMRSFWMKNTPLPLDIIFIRADGTVVNVAADTTPFSTDGVPSEGPARFVFEVNAGVAAEIGLEPGDRLLHRRVED